MLPKIDYVFPTFNFMLIPIKPVLFIFFVLTGNKINNFYSEIRFYIKISNKIV